MHLDHYEFVSGNSSFSYEFTSTGPKGHIRKAVQFSLIYDDNIFNLAFGDVNAVTGDIDDLAISDNKDTEKILATVVAIVYSFFNDFPDAWIYAVGSTNSRTRLYNMGINRYFSASENDFHIMAERNGIWEIYKKGNRYDAFLVKKKL